MLNSHPDIAIPYESHFFVPYFKSMERFQDLNKYENRVKLITSILAEPVLERRDYLPKIEEINLNSFNSLGGAIAELYQAYALHFGKSVWGDKSPSYASEIHICHQLFPTATYIHIIRDGRDVASSIIRQWWGPTDFVTAVNYWDKTISICRKLLQMLPNDKYCEIKFEDLVQNPESTLRFVLDFLGLEFSDELVGAYVHTTRKQLGSLIDGQHRLLETLPSADQGFKWKNNLSKVDQAIAYEIAGRTLHCLGYESGVKRHPLKLIRKIYHHLRQSIMWRLGFSNRALKDKRKAALG